MKNPMVMIVLCALACLPCSSVEAEGKSLSGRYALEGHVHVRASAVYERDFKPPLQVIVKEEGDEVVLTVSRLGHVCTLRGRWNGPTHIALLADQRCDQSISAAGFDARLQGRVLHGEVRMGAASSYLRLCASLAVTGQVNVGGTGWLEVPSGSVEMDASGFKQ